MNKSETIDDEVEAIAFITKNIGAAQEYIAEYDHEVRVRMIKFIAPHIAHPDSLGETEDALWTILGWDKREDS